MLCYESLGKKSDEIEECYTKEFTKEIILEISGMFDDGYNGVYPGEQYCGVKIKTQNHTICAYIDPERNCCERYGSILSQDDLEEFVGSELKKVYLTNTADRIEYIDYIRSKRSTSTDYYNIQFINFETEKGMFQLTVYNCDNGYYGHDIVIKVDENVEYKKTVCGDMVWEDKQNRKRNSLKKCLSELYPNAKEDAIISLCERLWSLVCSFYKDISRVELYVNDFEEGYFGKENCSIVQSGETIQYKPINSKCGVVLEKVVELLQ